MNWQNGARALFEYHCNESHTSAHAEVWYRSHQPVTVLEMTEPGIGETADERGENGAPRCYRVRWQDGYEFDVFEDELSATRDVWHRPDPPASGKGRPRPDYDPRVDYPERYTDGPI